MIYIEIMGGLGNELHLSTNATGKWEIISPRKVGTGRYIIKTYHDLNLGFNPNSKKTYIHKNALGWETFTIEKA